jgi:hypothetical protein
MWKIMTIRRSYYENEEILVWVRNLEAVIDLLPLLGTDAATLRNYNGDLSPLDEADADADADVTPYFCFICEKFGKDCTC